MEEVDGKTYPRDLADQDFVHCGKKLVNHLTHASLTLNVGGNTFHMNHIQIVHDTFNPLEHGLQQGDIVRQDRMNWESAQRLMFPKVCTCLAEINDGTASGNRLENVKGTMMYLELCWLFIEIFLSSTASLITRVMYASCVVNMLRIWRLWVFRSSELSLKTHFLSRMLPLLVIMLSL